MALVPTPGFPANPFPCDGTGNLSQTGFFACYGLTIYTHNAATGFQNHLGRLQARVIVAHPATVEASVIGVVEDAPFVEISTVNGNPVMGIEPTLTVDGRLLVFQGFPGDILVYSYNQTPENPNTWSEPRGITDMFYFDRDQPLVSSTLSGLYPFARAPLRSADGQPLPPGTPYRGNYPWISQEGAEIIHAALVAGLEGRDRSRRGGISIIGRWTQGALKHIDGPINPNREARTALISTRLFTSSPGSIPGNWTPYRDSDNPVPYLTGRPMYPIFSSVGAVENMANPGETPAPQSPAFYGEVALDDFQDGKYVLFLHMNEMISSDFAVDPTRTADTSGRFNTGLLEGAAFPQEFSGFDGNIGVGGQAILFTHGARVRVPASSSLDEARDGLTVQLFVNPLVNLAQDAADRPIFLANKPGAWSLTLEEDRRLQASVTINGTTVRSGPIGAALPLGQWTHVAFTFGPSGALRIYLGGTPVGGIVIGSARIDTSAQDLIIGPGGQTPLPDFLPPSQAVVILDEVAVSRVERSPAEIARAAYHQ
jgi:hypothetical protein